MAHLILSRGPVGRAPASGNGILLRYGRPIVNTDTVKWIIRYTFYAFIFSLPFEEAFVAGGTTLPKLFGLALAAFALLQARLCYKFPPKAFWWFAVYLFVFALWGSYLILVPPNVPEFNQSFKESVFRLTQLLALFWISYNLMKEEQVASGALWALTAATVLLAMLQVLGVTSEAAKQASRMTAFESNPNGLATILSLGLLALFGLAYGRIKHDWKARLLFWLASGILVIAIVQTGSRGAVVAVVGALSIFFLRGKSFGTKLKFGLIGLAGIIVLAAASYQVDAVRKRWEKTFYEQDTAGRGMIYYEAMGMILESPLIGWGPVNHIWELGPRTERNEKGYRDPHNLYLWILAEVGLVGAVPFFGGVWLCLLAAWKARHSIQGILPLGMLLFVLVSGLKGTPHLAKFFWVILSYALAASSYMAGSSRSQMTVSGTYPGSGAVRRRHQLVKVPAQGRSRGLSRSR